ncbi:unnamed protein product [Ectocarpus fasciculatus]
MVMVAVQRPAVRHRVRAPKEAGLNPDVRRLATTAAKSPSPHRHHTVVVRRPVVRRAVVRLRPGRPRRPSAPWANGLFRRATTARNATKRALAVSPPSTRRCPHKTSSTRWTLHWCPTARRPSCWAFSCKPSARTWPTCSASAPRRNLDPARSLLEAFVLTSWLSLRMDS